VKTTFDNVTVSFGLATLCVAFDLHMGLRREYYLAVEPLVQKESNAALDYIVE
jgi:hypothetical protein